ncbi:uncharacterized protein LOC143849813 isoform X2 [Tasmannia lanceolata]|uniref:uncharacterized protein LOC143849813 isoform X2 n=1 Tax=Tasmannia lanceolata TaxID=3420 RepID=UPI0040646857
MNSSGKYFPAKQEGGDDDNKIPKGSSSSRPWSGLKDPRIVRVSRSLGGKDRHSKVSTIRGLRDRRVRLSVPTAIQLYDLQDRLGLNQPSKVVDWLLNAAQHEIDKLPPLQIAPENFALYPQPTLVSHQMNPSQVPSSSINIQYLKSSGTNSLTLSKMGNVNSSNNGVGEDQTTLSKSMLWNLDASLRTKCKEVKGEENNQKTNWNKGNEEGNQVGVEVQSAPVLAYNFLNNAMPYTSYYHWELPTNASHLGGLGYSSQTEEPLAQSSFPSYVSTSTDNDQKQINYFQMLSSTSQNLLPNSITTPLYSISPTMRPLQVNITPKLHHSQNNSQANSFQNDSKATLGSNIPSSAL